MILFLFFFDDIVETVDLPDVIGLCEWLGLVGLLGFS